MRRRPRRCSSERSLTSKNPREVATSGRRKPDVKRNPGHRTDSRSTSPTARADGRRERPTRRGRRVNGWRDGADEGFGRRLAAVQRSASKGKGNPRKDRSPLGLARDRRCTGPTCGARPRSRALRSPYPLSTPLTRRERGPEEAVWRRIRDGQRQGGNGRAETRDRLQVREVLRGVVRVAGKLPSSSCKGGRSEWKRGEPQGRQRDATSPRPCSGTNRRGGAKPRGRIAWSGWSPGHRRSARVGRVRGRCTGCRRRGHARRTSREAAGIRAKARRKAGSERVAPKERRKVTTAGIPSSDALDRGGSRKP